jgi:cyclophilin family peptidyl-prolyl cis-trans isomerase
MKRFALLLLLLGLASGCIPRPTSPSSTPTKAPDAKKADPHTKDAPPTPAPMVLDPPVDPKNPQVVIDTSMGTIKVELFQDKAPGTVQNFLDYVDAKFYDGVIFHRVMAKENTPNHKDFMIQTGGFKPGMVKKDGRAAIKNEADNGLSNKRGTLAMARTNDPDSATSQFFINVADNGSDLDRTPVNPGYAVFGRVIEGMDVVDKIKAVRTGVKTQRVEIDGKIRDVPHGNVPVEDVLINSIRRAPKN